MSQAQAARNGAEQLFVGQGELIAHMRAFDWSQTGLGSVDQWPQSLRTALGICLGARLPMLVGWGPQLILLYNDACRASLGLSTTVYALGQPGQQSCPEIWQAIGPMLASVRATGQAVWSDDQALTVNRNGHLEECYFSFSCSPIRDESGDVGGVFITVIETSQRVLGAGPARALGNLADAGDQTARLLELTAALADVSSIVQAATVVVAQAMAAVGATAGAVALLSANRAELQMVSDQGISPEHGAAWRRFPSDAALPIADAARTGTAIWLTSQAELDAAYPQLTTSFSPARGATAALPLYIDGQSIGALGLRFAQPRTFDTATRAFLGAIAQQCAQAIERARLYEAEQRIRAELELSQRRASLLANAGALFSSSLDESTILTQLVQLAVPFLADSCAVEIVAGDGGIQRIAIASSDHVGNGVVSGRNEPDSDMPDTHALVEHVIRSGQSVCRPALAEQPAPPAAQHTRDGDLAMSGALMVVPLVAGGRVLGALTFESARSERRYSAANLALAEDLARRAAVAIDNVRLYLAAEATALREKHHAFALRMLADAAQVINATLELDKLLQIITAQARAIVGAHQAITSLTIGQNWAQALSSISLSDKYAAWQDYLIPPDRLDIYRLVGQENRAMRLTQAELNAHPAWRNFVTIAAEHPPLRGWLAAPLTNRAGANIGLIQLSDKYMGEFTVEDEAILVQLAQLASVALENARLYREVQVAMRARDDVFSLVSHDLKNPLGVIRASVQHLQRRLQRNASIEPQSIAGGLARIEGAAVKMLALLNDLLDLAHLQVDQPIELDRQPIDLVALVQQAVVEQQQTTSQHQIRFAASLTGLEGLWDAARIERVIANLISNAIKYSPAGGAIDVSLARETSGDSDWALLTVADHGLGIPPADLPYVFERFHRGANVAGQINGSGLGLASARQIIEQHQGSISAASNPGGGATFTVRLPIDSVRSAPDRTIF